MTRRRTLLTCAAIAMFGLALRLALVVRPQVVIDRLFVPDDTYYTLAIARSVARGVGPSVDGVHLTSGFQPLLAYLLVPVFSLSDDPDLAFRAVLTLGSTADALSAFLLGWLAYRGARSSVGAIVATSLWALSTAAMATALNGLETSLAIASVLAATAAWSVARAGRGACGWALCGMTLGVCLFARVDTVFFVVALGIVTLLRAGLRAVITTAVSALMTIAPWWAFALSRFGTIVPESGAAVREQTSMYRALGMNVRDHVAWATGAVAGPPMFESTWLREALGSGASGVGFVIGLAIVAVLVYVALRRGGGPDELRILALYAGSLFLFYSLYLPATWFFRRYLAPVHAVSALGGAMAIAHVWSARVQRPRRARLVVLGVALSLVAGLAAFVRLATISPSMTVDQGHHGAKGYREPARQIVAIAPPGAVIGSFQSGALHWFADGSGRTVVNLDGVVDRDAAHAVRDHRIAAFARSRGVTHLADWQVNAKLFVDRSGDDRITQRSLRKFGEAEPQGKDERFVLYEIEWPDE